MLTLLHKIKMYWDPNWVFNMYGTSSTHLPDIPEHLKTINDIIPQTERVMKAVGELEEICGGNIGLSREMYGRWRDEFTRLRKEAPPIGIRKMLLLLLPVCWPYVVRTIIESDERDSVNAINRVKERYIPKHDEQVPLFQ